jgi:anion-transporting  ArsA/GET3 family ATPase
MTFGTAISEQDITVAFDPRLEISQDAIIQKYAASKELERYQAQIAAVVKQLVESKNTATALKLKLEKEHAKKHKKEISASKEIIKKVDGLIALYLGTIDKRQGITRNPEVTVNQRFGTASRYIRSRFGEQTATEKTLTNQFTNEFKKTVSKTNSFFETEWTTYKNSLEKIEISPFKDIKIFTTN